MSGAVGVQGCASAPGGGTAGGRAASGTTIPTAAVPEFARELSTMARREERTPSRRAAQAPIPPGVDAALVARIGEGESANGGDEARLAAASLNEALAQVASQSAPIWGADGAAEAEPADEDSQAAAVRRYIAGRTLLQSGDAVGAAAEFEAAAALDPAAAEPWRELGASHLARGDRLSAVAAFRQALRRDPSDETSLVRVGLAALDRRDFPLAAYLLGRAWEGLGESSDPALRHVIGVGLGRALHRMGYLAAGNEALVAGLDGLQEYSSPTAYARELSDVLREAGDAWREIGDAYSRLGRYSDALAAYARASALPSFDPGALTPRRVLAAMRAGRPADAALTLLEEISAARGRADERTLRLIEYVRANSDVGPAMVRAIDALAAGLPDEARRLAAGPLVRARAAALPDGPAIEALQARFAEDPTDDDAVSDLFNRVGRGDANALTRAALRLIAAAPIYEGRCSGALLRFEPDSARLLAALDDARGAEADLLRARVLATMGRGAEAQDALRRAMGEAPDNLGVRIAWAEWLVTQGLTVEALEAIRDLKARGGRATAYARARALRALGRSAEALTAIEEAVFSPDATAEEALLAGQLMADLGRPSDAEQMLQIAIDLDPSMEEAYAGLISLHQPSGPLPDQVKLADALRALRAAAPSSRTIRWLRAQDLLRAGRFDQAERELIGLAEEAPDDAVAEALVGLWIRTGSTDRALEWLGSRRAVRPDDPTIALLMARVLAEADRQEEAITLLREVLGTRPGDARLSRELETILRSPEVGRAAEADALARERLRSAPVTFDSAIELAQVLLRADDVEGAAEAITAPLEEQGAAAPAIRAQAFTETWRAIGRRAMQVAAERPEALAAAAAMMDRIIRTQPDAPVEAYSALIATMVRSGFTAEQVCRTAEQGAERHPESASRLFMEAAQWFLEAGSQAQAREALRCGSLALASPAPELLDNWFRMAVSGGEPDEVDACLTRMVEAGVARTVAARIAERALPTDRLAAAELAYESANFFSGADREDDAEAMYRVALRFNPRHAMANNNLGYRLADEGRSLSEAHSMLRIAMEEEPEDPSIIDSLGWVRYKLGLIGDQDEPDGSRTEGAVTLLRRAIDLAAREPVGSPIARLLNLATIEDHLGDALWRSGDRAGALEAWNRSVAHLDDLAQQGAEIAAAIEEVERLRPAVQAKIDRTSAGEEPAVAPSAGPGL